MVMEDGLRSGKFRYIFATSCVFHVMRWLTSETSQYYYDHLRTNILRKGINSFPPSCYELVPLLSFKKDSFNIK